jgi:hypothetical protein
VSLKLLICDELSQDPVSWKYICILGCCLMASHFVNDMSSDHGEIMAKAMPRVMSITAPVIILIEYLRQAPKAV